MLLCLKTQWNQPRVRFQNCFHWMKATIPPQYLCKSEHIWERNTHTQNHYHCEDLLLLLALTYQTVSFREKHTKTYIAQFQLTTLLVLENTLVSDPTEARWKNIATLIKYAHKSCAHNNFFVWSMNGLSFVLAKIFGRLESKVEFWPEFLCIVCSEDRD